MVKAYDTTKMSGQYQEISGQKYHCKCSPGMKEKKKNWPMSVIRLEAISYRQYRFHKNMLMNVIGISRLHKKILM